jgi:hypothetical protein
VQGFEGSGEIFEDLKSLLIYFQEKARCMPKDFALPVLLLLGIHL